MIVLSNLFFYSIYKFWEGAWGWGPRFLVIIVPYFVLSLGPFLEGHRTKKWILVLSLILVVSFLVQVPAILVIYQRHYYEVSLLVGEDYLDRISLDPRYSPLINQWKVVGTVLENIRRENFLPTMALRQWEGKLIVPEEIRERVQYLLENNIFYNSFNFWLLYLYYIGFSIKMVLGITLALILGMFFSAYQIWKMLFGPSKNPGSG